MLDIRDALQLNVVIFFLYVVKEVSTFNQQNFKEILIYYWKIILCKIQHFLQYDLTVACTLLLTHISLASFLWDIGKQHSPRCDPAECGVPSGAIL